MQTTEQREEQIYIRSVKSGSGDFLRDIPQIHFLWQLYYSAGAKVNRPHPAHPDAKTFKNWLIHLTPEEYEVHVERYRNQGGFTRDDFAEEN